MVRSAGNESSGAFILIAAVVVLFVLGALLATKLVLKNTHDKMRDESNAR